MNRWKGLGFTLVFAVPAQMPLAAWLGAAAFFAWLGPIGLLFFLAQGLFAAGALDGPADYRPK